MPITPLLARLQSRTAPKSSFRQGTKENLFHVTHSGLDEGLPFIGNKAGRSLRRRACVASALRAVTSSVVVRRTAVTAITLTETLTELHRGNPLEVVEHIATSHSRS